MGFILGAKKKSLEARQNIMELLKSKNKPIPYIN
jgi:hypothetical protein